MNSRTVSRAIAAVVLMTGRKRASTPVRTSSTRQALPILVKVSGQKKLRLRLPDQCAVCNVALPVGTVAWWHPAARTVTCGACYETEDGSVVPRGSDPPLDRGRPGASLDREFERRRQTREQRIRGAHPRIGGFLLAFNGDPQHQTAFRQGAAAERAVAAALELRTNHHVINLHNRRMPRGRGDIDHIAIAPTGVYVIDTKDWAGKLEVHKPWRREEFLTIRGRDCTRLIDGLERQLAAVQSSLQQADVGAVAVHGALCFTKAGLPWLRTQEFRGHLLIYRGALIKRLNRPGPLSSEHANRIARQLAAALPPA